MLDKRGIERTDLSAAISSSNAEIASVDALGNVTGEKPVGVQFSQTLGFG